MTKPVWSSDMTDGKMFSNLRAKTLARILTSTFNREIGLYEEHSVGCLAVAKVVRKMS